MTGLCIFSIVLFISLTALCVPFGNSRLYGVNPNNFKRKKVKYLSFLFRGVGGKNCIYGDVKEYGIIYPIYVFHILGYLLATLLIGLVFILLFVFKMHIALVSIILFSVFLGFACVYCIATMICVIISKKRDKIKEKQS
ncbi:MAG: hypothetical protein J1F18_14505 [Lachnospiraceae bacterium]|nr:hypothetical protein [Lachnospiraceae bacterium]